MIRSMQQLFTSLLILWNVSRVYSEYGGIPGSSNSKDDEDPTAAATTTTKTATVVATDRNVHFFQNDERRTLEPSSFELITNLSPLKNRNDETVKSATRSIPTILEENKPARASIPGGESISLQYIQNFLPPQTIQELIHSCDARNGWTTSPQSIDGKVTAARTSRSCPLIWPLLYLPLLQEEKGKQIPKHIVNEIHLTWDLTQRISSFLNVDESRVEPLQLVRYLPGQYYKEHHDHGSYYGAEKTEQRPWTFLVFLSTMPVSQNFDSGGYTKFRMLNNTAMIPYAGDGLLWRNVDEETDEVLLDAIHEAVPPKNVNMGYAGSSGEEREREKSEADKEDGPIVKYAMNVWISKEKIIDNFDGYRTT